MEELENKTYGFTPEQLSALAEKIDNAGGGGGGLVERTIDVSTLPKIDWSIDATLRYQKVTPITSGGTTSASGAYPYLSLQDLFTPDEPGVTLYKVTLTNGSGSVIISTAPGCPRVYLDALMYTLNPQSLSAYVATSAGTGQDAQVQFLLAVFRQVKADVTDYLLVGGGSSKGVPTESSGVTIYTAHCNGNKRSAWVLQNFVPIIANLSEKVDIHDESINQLSSKIKKANWEQNDSNGWDYIQNRPFYEISGAANTITIPTLAWTNNLDRSETTSTNLAAQCNLYDGSTDPDLITLFKETKAAVIGNHASTYPVQKVIVHYDGGETDEFTNLTCNYYNDEMMGDASWSLDSAEMVGYFHKFSLTCSIMMSDAEIYGGSYIWLYVRDISDAQYKQVTSIEIKETDGTLVQLDSKFIKIDNNTIKVNANGELYVDVSALNN